MAGDPKLLHDPHLPRWWPTGLRLTAVRTWNAAVELAHLRPGAAREALRPHMICPCKGWTPCRAYYLKGWYTYCPNCGVYLPC